MSYQVGDLVWAKIRGFSPWPGLVSQPWPELRTPKKGPNKIFIYFFGTKNYGWSSASNLKPYHEFKDQLKESSKKSNFKLAVEEIEMYIENAEKFKSWSQNTDSNNEICNGTTNGMIIQNGIHEDSRESSVIQEKCTLPNEKTMDVSVTLTRVDIYDCKRCSRAYMSLVELEDHAIDLHMDTAHVALDRLGDLCCDKCGSYFANTLDYNMHMLAHIRDNVHKSYGKRKINCDSKEYKTLEAKYQCEKCDAKYVLESTLTAHMAVHEPMPHICECGVAYYAEKDLATHKRLVHAPPIKTETRKKIPKIKRETLTRNTSDCHNDDDDYVSKTKRSKKRNPKAAKKRRSIKKLTDSEKELLENLVMKDDKFLCPICNKGIVSKRNVLVHHRIHTGDKRHSCQFCGKSFVQESALKVHVKRHTGVRDYVCKFCNKGFCDGGALSLHVRTHTGEKPYKCDFQLCGKRFSDPSAYQRHQRIHTNDKRYACDRCSKAFTDNSALHYHKKRHNSDWKHFCPTCGKGFYVKYYLDQHVQAIHLPRQRTYECEFCLKKFYKSCYLKMHVSNVHTREKEFHCDHCGRVYYCKPTLATHIREQHTIIFYCDKCHFKFYSETHLKQHKDGGCTKQVYVCEICNKEYLKKETYNNHINAHARLRPPVECHHCGQRCSEKRGLVYHIFTKHLGYPYKCRECSKKFLTRVDYKKHMCIKKYYTCKVCGMQFYKKDQYVIHTYRHKGLYRTYRCHCCDKLFNCKTLLRMHMSRQMRRNMPRCTPCHKP